MQQMGLETPWRGNSFRQGSRAALVACAHADLETRAAAPHRPVGGELRRRPCSTIAGVGFGVASEDLGRGGERLAGDGVRAAPGERRPDRLSAARARGGAAALL
jgi:hypothetical protein